MNAAEALTSIFAIFVPIAAIVTSFLYYTKARHQQKMAMIENGYQPPAKERQKKEPTIAPLKWGVFFMGIAVGLFMGFIMSAYTAVDDVVSYFSMILLFGGAGLVLINYLEGKAKKETVNG